MSCIFLLQVGQQLVKAALAGKKLLPQGTLAGLVLASQESSDPFEDDNPFAAPYLLSLSCCLPVLSCVWAFCLVACP